MTLDPPAYPYLLWLWMKVFGASEMMLRVPSLLAMTAALILFYCAARLFLSQQVALVATLLLALYPAVVFASIDARPYAFAMLATCATLYLLFRYRNGGSVRTAAYLGFATASMLAFHYMFAAIIPAILMCMVLLHEGTMQSLCKRLAAACGAFLLATIALLPGFLRVFHTRNTHVFEARPTALELLFAVLPLGTLCALGAVIVTSLLTGNRLSADGTRLDTKWLKVSLLLGLLPMLFFFAVSASTSLHMFTPRHYLVALPGCALASAILIQKILAPARQALFCFALTCMAVFQSLTPAAKHHNYTWKYALAAADANSAPDHVPLIVCSDYPEADFVSMPVPLPQTSKLYSQLSYYPVRTTVIPMPRTLNAEAIKSGRLFLSNAAAHHQRFLATGYLSSAGILNWLMQNAAPNYRVRLVGDFDHVRVLEFDPR